MYDKGLYTHLKGQSPESFAVAEQLCDGVLSRGMLVVRAVVARAPKNRMYEIAQIEVLDRVRISLKSSTSEVLLHLKFRAEMDFQENELKMAEAPLEIHGPRWNNASLEREDIVNHVGSIVHDWAEIRALTPKGDVAINPWSSSSSFVGCLALLNGVRTEVRMYHQYLLPYLVACFYLLHGTSQEKFDLAERTSSTQWDADIRRIALDSFLNRFGSFTVQAQRGNARDCFGNILAS
ncbi:hypothetical protein KGQ72_00750 [Patescibacteria group bacterium]|nr:hypothetical protein [Patescibacteria group bacterium]